MRGRCARGWAEAEKAKASEMSVGIREYRRILGHAPSCPDDVRGLAGDGRLTMIIILSLKGHELGVCGKTAEHL